MFKAPKLFSTSKGDKSKEKVEDDKSALPDEPPLHVDAHEDGGLGCNDDALLAQMREAVQSWITSMGKRLMSGSLNLINTPMPVTIFEPRSYLEKLADVWVYPRYLSMAADAVDPMDRMKFTITWFVAGLHHGFEKWKKPFNPILGETWQAVQADGSAIFLEQTSHHPPVSVFHIEGPGGKYSFRGLSQPNVALMLKYYGFKTVAKGFRYVQFQDGSQIDIHYPSYVMKGVVRASRPRAEVEGQAIFTYQQAGLKAIVQFGAVKGAKASFLRRTDAVKGGIWVVDPIARGRTSVSGENRRPDSKSQQESVDDEDEFESASETDWEERAGASGDVSAAPFSVDELLNQNSINEAAEEMRKESMKDGGSETSKSSVAKDAGSGKSMFGMSGLSKLIGIDASKEAEDPEATMGPPMVRLEGSWLSHIAFDGQITWVLRKEGPQRWQPIASPLPSDSRYRLDLETLKSGDLKQAQVMKEKLENRQRADKKLRSEASGAKY